MNETVFDRIELIERYATKQEKVIIEFLRTHPIKDLLLFSITEFSEKSGSRRCYHAAILPEV